ncbi:MAG: hypothetical protein ACRDKT_14185, partial [Actinomycetota bacterium]
MRDRPRVVLAMVDRHADTETPQISIGRLPALRMLLTDLEERGYRCVPLHSADARDDDETVVLWDYGSLTTLPPRVAKSASGRVVSWSLESPLVAHRAFHRIDRIAESSRALFAFPGAERLVPRGVNFRPLLWPNTPPNDLPTDDWSDRRLLVMINSNKGIGLQHAMSEIEVGRPSMS